MTTKQKTVKQKSGWIYYVENGERKRKLKIATVTGAEAWALCNDMVDSAQMSTTRKGVFESYTGANAGTLGLIMGCKNICETFPHSGRTGYHQGIKYCSKCKRFMYSDNVFCLCCSGNLLERSL